MVDAMYAYVLRHIYTHILISLVIKPVFEIRDASKILKSSSAIPPCMHVHMYLFLYEYNVQHSEGRKVM